MARRAPELPAPLAEAAGRFDAWRRSRSTRRIPGDLWSLAAALGARYGVSRTARALRVGYYDLKKRVNAATVEDRDEGEASPAFVEILTAASTAGLSGCVVEFERASGERMRIEMEGAKTSDVAELSRLFLEQRP